MPLLGSSNDLQVTVSTKADTSGLTEAESSLRGFQEAAENVTVPISSLTGAVDDADGSIRKIRESAEGAIGPITIIGEDGKQAFVDVGNSADDAKQKLTNTGKSVDDTNTKFSGLWKTIAGGQLAFSAVQSAINLVTSSVGDAIKRVDTLNNSSKVFGNLGFKADDVKTAMDALNSSIKGLPTSLDQAVSGMQSLALQNGDIVVARKEFTAMNDAVLSTGGSTAQLENAIQQITQLDMNGPLDAQTWNSLRQSGMEPAMKAMADMKNISLAQLKTEFGDGTLTVQDFMNMLQQLDANGTGNMASLSKQAKDMTGGIGTGMANAKTAVVRGMADIIQAVGSQNISDAISKLGTYFEHGLKIVAPVIATTISSIESLGGTILTHVADVANWHLWMQRADTVLLALAGDTQRILKVAIGDAKLAFDKLLPSIITLKDTFFNELAPSIMNLWTTLKPILIPFLEDMAKAFGVTLFAAIWLTINALNEIMKAITPVINYMAEHKQVVIDLGLAFLALAGYMAFNAVFSALAAGFTTLTTVTIPAVMTSITALKATISSGTVFGPVVIAAALIALQQVYDSAQKTRQAVDAALSAQAKAADQGDAIKNEENLYKQGKITKAQETKAINALLAGVDAATRQANGHASGGLNIASGWSWVGENGPELAYLPQGSNVYTNNQSKSMAPSMGGKQVTVHQNNNFYTQYDPTVAAQELGFRLAHA